LPPPTPLPSTPAPASDILLQDDFSDPTSGWPDDGDEISRRGYEDGGYVIEVLKLPEGAEGWMQVSPYEATFDDVVVEVDARWLGGSADNAFGIVCRYQDIDNFVRLVISSDGYSLVERQEAGESIPLADWTEAVDWDPVPTQHHLRADCVGDRFRLYVDGTLIADVVGDGPSEGQIGLVVSAYQPEGTRIRFDNLVVRRPPTGATMGPAIANVAFSLDVTPDAQPIEPATTFTTDATEVYASFDYSGFEGVREVYSVWLLNGEPEVSGVIRWDEATPTGRTYIYLQYEDGIPAGEWEWALYVGDVYLGGGTFTVVEPHPTG
ncbi:MAG: hypothetical protein D6759_08930, partial [Chloroflexi bacterium]